MADRAKMNAKRMALAAKYAPKAPDAGEQSKAPLQTPRTEYLERLELLRAERSTWLSHWQEISDYIFPRRFRYLTSDRNKGYKRNDRIINNTPTRAVRTLGAGKQTGMTSPARPWFEFDTDGMSDEEASWTEGVEKAVYSCLARSNIYGKLHEMWEGQAAFATWAFLIAEDEKTDARAYSWPIGQYMLACSARQEIDTAFREFGMTVAQMVSEFGIGSCSPLVQQLFKDRKLDTWIDVCHVIEPNVSRESGKLDAKNMPFRSCYFEKGATQDNKNGVDAAYQGMLRVSGYEEFPVMVARWYVTGEDVYGSGSPGMDVLGDCKALQLAERRKATAVDLTVKPPMKGPTNLRTQKISLLPGDVTYVDEEGTKGAFKPAIEPPQQAVPNSIQVIREHEFRINETFFVDLFNSMQAMDDAPNGGKQPVTAREINERHEEKMILLGPVVENDQTDVLGPLITRLVGILARRGKLPPPPPTMRGRTVGVRYTSVMAQAQKLLGTAAIERFTSFIGSLSAVRPDILDLPNFDKIVTDYAEMLGVSVDEMNTAEVVQQIRAQRQQQQQQQQQMAALQQGADAAKVASQADLNGDNVLSRLLNTTGGGGGAIGGQP
jgi:hypothetical protein